MDDAEQERERRRKLHAELRESNSARIAELDREIAERVFMRPIEHQTDRDRRELAERAAQLQQQRETSTARAAATSAPDWSGWENWLRARLDAERAVIIEAVGQALGQEMQKARAAAKRELAFEVRLLRIELCEANETITDLRKAVEASNRSGAAEVIDLVPASRRN